MLDLHLGRSAPTGQNGLFHSKIYLTLFQSEQEMSPKKSLQKYHNKEVSV